MTDHYIDIIIGLLPLTALMLVFQVNPYHALVIRAILGAVAALVYAVLGAADVALTEALVGTMLAVTLYVVAVRSSLVMRLGIVEDFQVEQESYTAQLIANLRTILNKYHLSLELIEYPNPEALERALMAKEVHATCTKPEKLQAESDWGQSKLSSATTLRESDLTYKTSIRVRRLFDILQAELSSPKTILTYVTVSNVEDKH